MNAPTPHLDTRHDDVGQVWCALVKSVCCTRPRLGPTDNIHSSVRRVPVHASSFVAMRLSLNSAMTLFNSLMGTGAEVQDASCSAKSKVRYRLIYINITVGAR